jgi:hypothetical protein
VQGTRLIYRRHSVVLHVQGVPGLNLTRVLL